MAAAVDAPFVDGSCDTLIGLMFPDMSWPEYRLYLHQAETVAIGLGLTFMVALVHGAWVRLFRGGSRGQAFAPSVAAGSALLLAFSFAAGLAIHPEDTRRAGYVMGSPGQFSPDFQEMYPRWCGEGPVPYPDDPYGWRTDPTPLPPLPSGYEPR